MALHTPGTAGHGRGRGLPRRLDVSRRHGAAVPPPPRAVDGLPLPAPPEPEDLAPGLSVLAQWLEGIARPVGALGICAAGDASLGRLLGQYAGRGLTATLVEPDALVAVAASQTLRSRGVQGIEIVAADVGDADSYVGRVPADLVLLGPGVVEAPSLRRRGLAEALPSLLCQGGHLYWWASGPAHVTSWPRTLAAVGLDEVARGEDGDWGLSRLVDGPRALRAGARFFPRPAGPPG